MMRCEQLWSVERKEFKNGWYSQKLSKCTNGKGENWNFHKVSLLC